jgi:hypothetical protein
MITLETAIDKDTVYIKPVMKTLVAGGNIAVDGGDHPQKVWAIFNHLGSPTVFLEDRNDAFELARVHGYKPMSVH